MDLYDVDVTVQIDRIYTKTYVYFTLRLDDGDENTAANIGGNKHFWLSHMYSNCIN